MFGYFLVLIFAMGMVAHSITSKLKELQNEAQETNALLERLADHLAPSPDDEL